MELVMNTLRTFVLGGVVLAAPVLLPAQQFTGSHKLGTLPAPVVLDNTGLFQAKFARVGDDMFLAGQPTENGLRELRDRGVKVVVNLRTPEEMKAIPFDEAALVSALGMKYVYLPVRGDDRYPYSPETVARFADAVRDADGKVLLHCTVAWRASHLWAAYLIKVRGVGVDSALANARAINLMDDHHMSGAMPLEDFLGGKLSGFKR
jgi:uncharacterized protein (TIGR01244 family)